MTEPKNALVRAPAALAAPMPLVVEDGIELVDAFDDDSLEMNETGDGFRVRRYHSARRIIGVSEPTLTTTGFTVITACQVPIPVRAVNVFYKFRGLVIYETSDVSEGMAVRMGFDGVLFGQHRYRVVMGDTISAPTTRFEIFGAVPAAQTGGPGAALGYAELEGTFAVEAASSGNLSFEVACETGSPQFVKPRVGTFLEVMQCS